jgi:hypothetical protein
MERWDGAAWRTAITPNPENYNNGLTDVSCPSASDCWTLGGGTGLQGGFFEHWNGTSWQVVPMPSASGTITVLTTVRCLATDWCWSVGTSNPTGNLNVSFAAAMWNGHEWITEPIPSPAIPLPTEYESRNPPFISQMTCLPSGFCVAVGSAPRLGRAIASTVVEALS